MIEKIPDYETAKGWLRAEERELLFSLAQRVSANVENAPFIVNLGVEWGSSIVCLRAGAPDATIYGIDLDISKAPDGLNISYIEGDSYEVIRQWGEGCAFDLIFVDGDHSYDGVLRDCCWTEFVNEGGYAVFHDCYDYDDPGKAHELVPGVNKAVEEWWSGADNWRELRSAGTCRVFRRVS